MISHVQVSCPQCSHELAVRVQKLGRNGICKHCGTEFRARLDEASEPRSNLPHDPNPFSEGEDAGRGNPGLASVSDSVWTLLAGRTSGHDSTRQPIEDAAGQDAQFRDHDEDQERVGLASLVAPADPQMIEPEKEWGADNIELGGRLTQAAAPRDEEAFARDQEIESLRSERDRLRGETRLLRSLIEVQSAEVQGWMSCLDEVGDAVRMEAEWTAAELNTLSWDLKQAEEQLWTERDALAQELDRLRREIEELGRSRRVVEAEHAEARHVWEGELREREERWERERQELVAKAGREIDLQRDRIKSEHKAWSRERKEHSRTVEERARVAEERDQFAQEVGRLRDRLGKVARARDKAEAQAGAAFARWEEERQALEARWDQQRRELIAEAESKTERLLTEAEIKAGRERIAERDRSSAERDALTREVERLRAEAAVEIVKAREQWEGERSDLESQWGQQLQDLLADAQRQLLEQRARFDAERQGWRAEIDERERQLIERDSLARESEEIQGRLGAERDALARELRQLRDGLDELEKARSVAELEVRKARARWEIERDELEEQWARERNDLIAGQRAGREQLDRLIDERDSLTREVGQLRGRLEETEHRQSQDETQIIAAGKRWEEERRELEVQWERRYQDLLAGTERRLAEQGEEFEGERRSWSKQDHADHAPPLEETEALKDSLDAVQRERDGALRDILAIGLERDRLHAKLQEVESALHRLEQSHQFERDKLVAVQEQAREDTESMARLGAEEALAQRAELEERRRHLEAKGQEYQRKVDSWRREWSAERQRWLNLFAAAHPQAHGHDPVPQEGAPHLIGMSNGQPAKVETPAARTRGAEQEGDASSATLFDAMPDGGRRRPRRRGTDFSSTPRPQANSYHDPGAFRSDLEHWVGEARSCLQKITANPDSVGNDIRRRWLAYEIRTALTELGLRLRDSGPEQPVPQQEPVLPHAEI